MSQLTTVSLVRKAVSDIASHRPGIGSVHNVADTIFGLTGSGTVDPGNLGDAAGSTHTITVTGAALGDYALVSAPYDLQGITCTAYVSAANTVSFRLQNETGGAIDLASGTWRAKVIKAV